jgi:hypothetical protein
LRQRPIGAAAGERKAELEIRRGVVIHAAGIAVVGCGEIIRADDGIAVIGAAAAIARAPGGPAPLEVLRRGLLRRIILERPVVGERELRGNASSVSAKPVGLPLGPLPPPPVPSATSDSISRKLSNSWNVLVDAPVDASPSSALSAPVNCAGVRLNRF